MNILIRAFAAAFIVCFFAALPARAQELPMSDRQKAEIARQKAYEKATDQAYEAAMKRSHDTKPKAPADPWASVRTPSSGAGN